MNQKDLIKWGLVVVGAYLVWKYIEDHGGLAAMMGTALPAPPVGAGAGSNLPATATTPATTVTQSTPPAAPAPATLDMTGLTVVPDINGSFTGTVKINGVPTTLSIITADGRIFNTSGQEVTSTLQASGIDVAALRTAFQNAGAGMSGIGLGAWGRLPYWLN